MNIHRLFKLVYRTFSFIQSFLQTFYTHFFYLFRQFFIWPELANNSFSVIARCSSKEKLSFMVNFWPFRLLHYGQKVNFASLRYRNEWLLHQWKNYFTIIIASEVNKEAAIANRMWVLLSDRTLKLTFNKSFSSWNTNHTVSYTHLTLPTKA